MAFLQVEKQEETYSEMQSLQANDFPRWQQQSLTQLIEFCIFGNTKLNIKEHSVATKSVAGLRQQMLLTSFKKEN